MGDMYIDLRSNTFKGRGHARIISIICISICFGDIILCDVSLCVGGSKEKVEIQISCIPESRDTSSCILGKIYP